MIITISVHLLPGTDRESKSTDHFKHSNVQPGPEQAFLTRTLSVESRKRLSLGTVHFCESLSKFSPRRGSGPPAGARRSRRFTVRIPAAPDIARAFRLRTLKRHKCRAPSRRRTQRGEAATKGARRLRRFDVRRTSTPRA